MIDAKLQLFRTKNRVDSLSIVSQFGDTILVHIYIKTVAHVHTDITLDVRKIACHFCSCAAVKMSQHPSRPGVVDPRTFAVCCGVVVVPCLFKTRLPGVCRYERGMSLQQ